jgi:protein farnesyltransferase/geranylgeranyltransferase type-1 subunit alpha
VLVALGEAAEWLAELGFCDDMGLAQQKNYQIWHHRQACVARLGAAVRERDLAHCARMLEDDSKNYHVWSYRQWSLLFHGAVAEEDAFSRLMIERDVRNNSAWNERYWVAEQLGWFANAETVKAEVEYALQQARRAPSNESPWLYLRGIAQRCPGAVEVARLEQLASQWVLCVPVRALLVFLHEKSGDTEAALRLCRECADTVDTMRAKYWNYRASTIKQK